DRLAAIRGVARRADDQQRARLIERLLCEGRAPILDDDVADRLTPFERMGLVTLAQDSVQLLPGAQPYARAIAACFDPYLRPAETRFSRAV
ncbi:MAG: coproporphyrinogen III oxidase, partial [bacterium]|nr:coproporphyrinogen III oxidase [bacterium]